MEKANEYQLRLAGLFNEGENPNERLPVGTEVEVRDTMRKGLSPWNGVKGYVAAHVNVEGEDLIVVRSQKAYDFQKSDLMLVHPAYVFKRGSDFPPTP